MESQLSFLFQEVRQSLWVWIWIIAPTVPDPGRERSGNSDLGLSLAKQLRGSCSHCGIARLRITEEIFRNK
jgi:hypothetical protein